MSLNTNVDIGLSLATGGPVGNQSIYPFDPEGPVEWRRFGRGTTFAGAV
jgi:hypothetical protein